MGEIDGFLTAAERLAGSDFLSAGREIREFLISLTEDESTRETILSCSAGYLINDDYKRVVLEHGALPQTDARTVAFVTALLFAVDTQRVGLIELLRNMYPTDNTDTAFAMFLDDLLTPYVQSMVNLIVGEPTPDVRETKTPAYDKMNEDITAAANDIIAQINSSVVRNEVKTDVTFACNGLVYALNFKDSFLTKIAYNGLVNTLFRHGIKMDSEDFIAATLRLYGVL